MFCTYCKNKEHLIDRSFKFHGYPPGTKINSDRKFSADASCSSGEPVKQNAEASENVIGTSQCEKMGSESSDAGLSKEQFGRLIGLLCKLGGQEMNSNVTHSFMLGPSMNKHLVLGNQGEGLYQVTDNLYKNKCTLYLSPYVSYCHFFSSN